MRKLVDWKAVQKELNDLPSDFKQERFDSLSRVIEILGAVDPSQALKELQEKQERIELLVDDIVKEYHVGFNKSIHNYSEILRLFSEAQSQVKSIRSSLVSSKKQLGSRTETLKRQWMRSNILNESIQILDDIEYVAHVPEQISKLCSSSKYKEAVELLTDAESRLSDNNMNQVKALLDLQNVLQEHKKQLREIILEHASSHLFAMASTNGIDSQTSGNKVLLERRESFDSSHGGESSIDELIRSLCMLDPETSFLADIAERFRNNLEKLIVLFLKDSHPFDLKGDLTKHDNKALSQLFNSKIVKYVHVNFCRLCQILGCVFERHFDLANLVLKATIAIGNNKSLAPEWSATMQRFSDGIQEECIRLLCNLLDRHEPQEIDEAISKNVEASHENRQSIRTSSMIHKSHNLKFKFNNFDNRNDLSLSPSRKEGKTKYQEYIGRLFGKENLGTHLILGLYGPCQDLTNIMEGKIVKSPKNHIISSKMMQFLEDHVLEKFLPSVKTLCKGKLRQILSSKAPGHKRSYSRDKLVISNGQIEEMSLVTSIIQQNLEYARAMPKFTPHFSVIIEAMLIKYFESSEKVAQLSASTLASKLASKEELVLLMSLERSSSSYLDLDYFDTLYTRQKYKSLKSEERLFAEIQDLRPLAAENLSDSLASFGCTARSVKTMQEILFLMHEFMDNCKAEKFSSFSTDGLATVSKGIKSKVGYLLRTIRLELRLKVTAAMQHLENFSVVANLGCDSFDRSLNSAVIHDNCSPYVVILLQSLKQCSDVLVSTISQKYYNYIFDGIEEWIMHHIQQYLFKLDFTNASRISATAKDVDVLQQAISSNSFFHLYKIRDDTFKTCRACCEVMLLSGDSILPFLENNKQGLSSHQLQTLVSVSLRRVDLSEEDQKKLRTFVENNVD